MYLQSLEILGFKSFAAKTTLNFHKGVTAIVGPNGCGKSNVLDAMRWVLGEQSAKALRGGEMADVIFSGTDSRQALGMAEVSLTFADCEKELGVDWNEVCITRRVFRDGNSEYFLNKTPCRLRDIQQLFMDTGIGRSAYSIMEQGKIDAILSSKPEDRRSIFEEAAGITKFKSQKKEALRKLEATETNLVRVNDIIKEVKRQIGSLQRQAAKARRYQALVADLKTLETHHARQQFDLLDTQLGKTRGEIERLREVHANQESEIESNESDVASQRQQLEELEEKLNTVRQIAQDLKNHIGNAEHRIAFNAERVSEFGSLVERYERDIASAEEKLHFQQTQIENTNLELEQISNTLHFEQDRLAEKTKSVNALSAERVETERAVQNVFSEIAKIENRLNALRAQSSSLAAQRDGSETRLSILQGEFEQLSAAGDQHGALHAEMSARLAEDTQKLESQNTAVRDADAEMRAISAELDNTDRDLRTENRTLSEKESKLEVLKQMNESGAGLAEGTQAVLRGLDNPDFFKPAIAGALAAHIQVEQEFIPAIEAALGQNLQAIVMKDTMVAESVLKTLSEKKLGRASLALREMLASRNSDLSSGELPPGALAWAAEKVNASGELAPLIRTLLRGVVIVPDLETALRLAPEDLADSFVTLAGETLSREGILTGGVGGKDNGASVLQRRNQIAQIETEAGSLRERISDLTARREETAQRLEAAKTRLAEAREEVQKTSVAVSTLRSQLQLIEREQRETAKKAENVRWERENIENRHREAVEKLAALETESHELSAKLRDFQHQQSELSGRLDELRSNESVLTSELNELRIKVTTEKQRHDSLNNQRAPMNARLHELEELIQQRRKDIENYRVKSANLDEESERIAAEIETMRERLDEAEQQVGGLVSERAEMASAIESLESTLRILRRQLSDCHEQRGQQDVKQTQIQSRLDHLAEHVQRRYQLDIREFQNDTYALRVTLRDIGKRVKKTTESTEDTEILKPNEAATATETAREIFDENDQPRIDWERVEALVRELDQRIDSMGPVNMDAIQEYDELEQRHTFLLQQFEDLSRSKAELLDVISKINTTTRKLFAETFEKVRANFSEMFIELFGGGKANLVLTDESDPLESGIDIIAKPPGKQLQSISLLSGGEKTMTAVALLFSIYMVKPSPFCVLDEMDAPLDESNIMRFVKILDRFVSQSQFVVITHNKRTIARADVLYGVTMEEHGVSKLVGVRFAKREDSAERNDLMGTANLTTVPSVAESFGKTAELHSEKIAS